MCVHSFFCCDVQFLCYVARPLQFNSANVFYVPRNHREEALNFLNVLIWILSFCCLFIVALCSYTYTLHCVCINLSLPIFINSINDACSRLDGEAKLVDTFNMRNFFPKEKNFLISNAMQQDVYGMVVILL